MFSEGFLQEQRHADLNILPTGSTRLALLAATRTLTKHRGEDVGEILGTTILFTPGLAAEVGFVSMQPHLVIFSPAFAVFQHFIGFCDFFKARFGIGLGTDIGVIFACQAAVGGFDSLDII
ncbi:hypothetical protein D3C78_1319110 [compost metagenome]